MAIIHHKKNQTNFKTFSPEIPKLETKTNIIICKLKILKFLQQKKDESSASSEWMISIQLEDFQ